MNNMIKCLVLFFVIFSSFSVSYANSGDVIINNVETDVYINKDVLVKVNDSYAEFYSADQNRVYPITYNDSTYLPIRAISSIYKMPILWDGLNNAIYLNSVGQVDTSAYCETNNIEKKGLLNTKAIINKKVKIIYNRNELTFYDVNGEVIYPILYDDTTYLPLRTLCKLFDTFIDYDFENNTVILGNSRLRNSSYYQAGNSGDVYSGDAGLDNYLLDFSGSSYGDSTLIINKEIKTNPSGDIIIKIAELNDSLCWGINLYEEDLITGKNIYENEAEEIFNEICKDAGNDELKRQLLIQKYNLDNGYNHYGVKNSDGYYFKIDSLIISKSLNDRLKLNNAKTINVSINDDYESLYLLFNDDRQVLDVNYVQKDISKPIVIKISIWEEYDENSGDLLIKDCEYQVIPVIKSNIPQGR